MNLTVALIFISGFIAAYYARTPLIGTASVAVAATACFNIGSQGGWAAVGYAVALVVVLQAGYMAGLLLQSKSERCKVAPAGMLQATAIR
jgi:hypothetical protein